MLPICGYPDARGDQCDLCGRLPDPLELKNPRRKLEIAKSINKQLNAEPLLIPDHWNADTIESGHEIGKPELLFSRIPPEKGEQWRELFGSDEAKKVKEEEAMRKAAKKGAKKTTKKTGNE